MASGNIHIGTMAGKLNGVMPATTPSGWRIEATSTRVETCVDSSPLTNCGTEIQASSTISMPRATSPSASECTLPCSAVISSAISSRCASSSSRYLNRMAVRLASEDGPPALEGGLGGGDGGVHLVDGRERHLLLLGAGGRVVDGAEAAGGALDGLALDPVVDVLHGVRAFRGAGAGSQRWRRRSATRSVVPLAGLDGGLAGGDLGDRHVPPGLGGGSGGRRVGLDVHARRPVRGAGRGQRLAQLAARSWRAGRPCRGWRRWRPGRRGAGRR